MIKKVAYGKNGSNEDVIMVVCSDRESADRLGKELSDRARAEANNCDSLMEMLNKLMGKSINLDDSIDDEDDEDDRQDGDYFHPEDVGDYLDSGDWEMWLREFCTDEELDEHIELLTFLRDMYKRKMADKETIAGIAKQGFHYILTNLDIEVDDCSNEDWTDEDIDKVVDYLLSDYLDSLN